MDKKLDIQIGDKVIYKDLNRNEVFTSIITYSEEIKILINNEDYEILKVERPKYEVVEEKKELLTEKEKKYLRNVIEPLKQNKIKVRKTKGSDMYLEIMIFSDDDYDMFGLPYIRNFKNLEFKNLTEDKEYTLEELGLEDI